MNENTIVQRGEQDTVGISSAAGHATLESCRLLDYKRDAVHCWHTGWTSQ